MDGTGYDKLHQQDIHYPQHPSNQITISASQEWASSPSAVLFIFVFFAYDVSDAN